jgi:Fic/DOC family
MENKRFIKLPEVMFPEQNSKRITNLLKKGEIRKLAPRIYTSNFQDEDSEIVRRNIWQIIGNLYPGAVLSHRSALEFKPTSTENIFISYSYTKNIKLPGIKIRIIEGHGRLREDNLLTDGLYVSQLERALLENLQISRQTGPDSKTLPLPTIEEKLEEIIRIKGESALNEIRDKAKIIADALALEDEYQKLTKIISSILATNPSKILISPQALARAKGLPYDPDRLSLFNTLFAALKQSTFPVLRDQNVSKQAFRNFAFFEAYFSNYIEGTIFEIDEAKQIIETGVPIPNRSGDSHDITGTYKIVSDTLEMSLVPETPQELLDILMYRHATIMVGRSDKSPGSLKNKNNRAGETFFVDHTLVKGTLIRSFDYYRNLDHPLARAMYIMFVISEIHLFLDGNGRVARIMMNAELVHKGSPKIMIPTVYRDDYMGALRRLTRQRDTIPYIKMMSRIHTFSHSIYGEDIDEMESKLRQSNAFKNHDESRLIF